MTKEEVRKRVQERMQKQLQPHMTPVRKSVAPTVDPAVASGGDEFEILKNDPELKGLSLSKYIRGAIKGNWHQAAREQAGYLKVQKVLSTLPASTGEFLLVPEHSTEIVELLRAKAVVRQIPGIRTYNLTGDTLDMGRQTGATTAHWGGPGTDMHAGVSDATFGDLKFVLKDCYGLTRINNNMIDDASPAVSDIVRQDLVQVLGLAEDLALIEGGGGTEPTGIYNDPSVSSTDLTGSTPTFDNLKDAQYAIELANGVANAWLMHPRTKNTLRQLKDGNGRDIWAEADNPSERPMLCGLPVFFSTQISIVLTSNRSYIILGDFNQFAIAQKVGIKMDASTDRYFEYNETTLRAILRTDCAVKQPGSFYIIKGVGA